MSIVVESAVLSVGTQSDKVCEVSVVLNVLVA